MAQDRKSSWLFVHFYQRPPTQTVNAFSVVQFPTYYEILLDLAMDNLEYHSAVRVSISAVFLRFRYPLCAVQRSQIEPTSPIYQSHVASIKLKSGRNGFEPQGATGNDHRRRIIKITAMIMGPEHHTSMCMESDLAKPVCVSSVICETLELLRFRN